jgi:hypothetical protein
LRFSVRGEEKEGGGVFRGIAKKTAPEKSIFREWGEMLKIYQKKRKNGILL